MLAAVALFAAAGLAPASAQQRDPLAPLPEALRPAPAPTLVPVTTTSAPSPAGQFAFAGYKQHLISHARAAGISESTISSTIQIGRAHV